MAKSKSKNETAVIAAFIAGAFAIVGPIITYFVTRSADAIIFNPIPEDRRAAMTGHWRGTVDQDFEGKQVSYSADMQIEVHGRTIRGQLHTKREHAGKVIESTFDMSGGFLHDRFARMDYRSTRPGAIHFGTLLLELSPQATELSGVASAFGAYSQKLVNATFTLTKVQ